MFNFATTSWSVPIINLEKNPSTQSALSKNLLCSSVGNLYSDNRNSIPLAIKENRKRIKVRRAFWIGAPHPDVGWRGRRIVYPFVALRFLAQFVLMAVRQWRHVFRKSCVKRQKANTVKRSLLPLFDSSCGRHFDKGWQLVRRKDGLSLNGYHQAPSPDEIWAKSGKSQMQMLDLSGDHFRKVPLG